MLIWQRKQKWSRRSLSKTVSGTVQINFVVISPHLNIRTWFLDLIVRYRNDAYKEGYKGCAAIGRYKVLVFDEDNLGSDFYKINLLKNDKPCDSGAYPRGSEDELLMALGMIKHDSVFDFFGCIPPDDWEPIPIRRKR